MFGSQSSFIKAFLVSFSLVCTADVLQCWAAPELDLESGSPWNLDVLRGETLRQIETLMEAGAWRMKETW